MFIQDPGSKISGSRIESKILRFFNSNLFINSRKYDPVCSSPDPDLDMIPIPDLRVKKAPDTGSRIRLPNTAYKD
jgi:hypothetical protein